MTEKCLSPITIVLNKWYTLYRVCNQRMSIELCSLPTNNCKYQSCQSRKFVSYRIFNASRSSTTVELPLVDLSRDWPKYCWLSTKPTLNTNALSMKTLCKTGPENVRENQKFPTQNTKSVYAIMTMSKTEFHSKCVALGQFNKESLKNLKLKYHLAKQCIFIRVENNTIPN